MSLTCDFKMWQYYPDIWDKPSLQIKYISVIYGFDGIYDFIEAIMHGTGYARHNLGR